MATRSEDGMSAEIAGEFNPQDFYETAVGALDNIISRVESVLPRPYHISKEESTVVPPMMGYDADPGVSLALKFQGKNVTLEDEAILAGFEKTIDIVAPVLEDIYVEYGIPVGIFPANNTLH